MSATEGSIAIGVDVGGTHIRAAAVNEAGRVLARRRRPTAEVDSATRLIGWVVEAASQLRSGAGISNDNSVPLGVAVPGVLDANHMTLLRSVNLPFMEGVPIRSTITEQTGQSCALVTDADAATWGEYATRTPKPGRFVHLRIGTGVACGVVVDGKLQEFVRHGGKHLDVMIVDRTPNAIPCRCGLTGCLETLASGAAFGDRARERGLSGGLEGFVQAYHRGDKRVVELVTDGAGAIREAVVNLAARFQPDVISVGGGVVTVLPELLAIVTAGEGPAIERARLGDDAGAVGAALLGRTAL
ncbi:MAG: ROK family protein [Phycisphaerae bacterium]|jgi:glucokinase